MPKALYALAIATLLGPALLAADLAERETTRFNEAVTKLMQARDEAQANAKAKSLLALTAIAKSRMKAEDTAMATEAWRAVLVIDREHVDARAYFTALGTLEAVLVELDAKPTDLLGLDLAPAPKDKADKTKDTEKAP